MLHLVEELKEKHHIPEMRQNIEKVNQNVPPHKITKIPIIRKSLFNEANKKNDPNSMENYQLV